MKKIAYTLLALLVVACANDRKSNAPLNEVEASEAFILDDADMVKSEAFTYQNLYTEKLQDYYDLLYVMNEHPEFYEDIKLQLEDVIEDSSLLKKVTAKTTIESLEQIGEVQILSDSVSSINLRFKKVSGGLVSIDSLKLIITETTFNLDDIKTTATKVVFSEFDE